MINIALVSQSSRAPFSNLQDAAGAMNKQLEHDFFPAWNIKAQVTAFPDAAPPSDQWPIAIMDDIKDDGALGFHLDENNQPFAVIEFTDSWTVTASHELLEMLADPYGNRLHSGLINGTRVRVLEEVCDPCEARSYDIDGVKVSEFVFPSYYSHYVPGRYYSLYGTIKSPLSVEFGGYLSWLDKDGNWWQERFFSEPSPITVNLGLDSSRPKGKTLREWLDSLLIKDKFGIHMMARALK